MNFVHRCYQRIQLNCGDSADQQTSNKNLLQKLKIKYQQARLLDNTEGFNVPIITEYTLKREIQKQLNSRIKHSADLNQESKFKGIGLGGYQSVNEKSYLLLVDVSKDVQKRQDEMEVDGGNLDDDNIEREWHQLTVITSIPFMEDGESDGRAILRKGLETCV